MEYGLIGKTLGHSFSQQIHAKLADYDYRLCECADEQAVADLLRARVFCGLNVTIPYKQTVLPLLDELSEEALAVGSVNTICNRGGKLIGYNTDVYGFAYLLDDNGIGVRGKTVALLGNGGAAQAVKYVLKERGAFVVMITRNGELNYQNLQHISHKIDIIVNCTPVGMFPDVALSPVSMADFPSVQAVVDLIYNPYKTQLLLQAEQRGVLAVNGLTMLVAQAKKASELFLQRPIADHRIEDIVESIRIQMANLLFVGMPGCGKTTVAREVARLTGRPFYDSDEEFAKQYGLSAGQAISQWGEQLFRDREAEILQRLCYTSGAVIAVGGGAVLRQDNRDAMTAHSQVCYLTRKIERLDTQGRPLSVDLPSMLATREPYYVQVASFSVSNDQDLSATVEQVLQKSRLTKE